MKKKSRTVLFFLCLLVAIVFPAAAAVHPASGDAPEEPLALPIIMYHEIKYQKLGKDVISPWEFESDLKYLQKNGYTSITVGDLLDYFNGGLPLPENPIMLTFDDGYLSTYKYALPLLEKYDMKIVLSIIVKNTDDFTETPDDNIDYSHVTWAQLNEMLQGGYAEVQNHSYNLHKITRSRYGCAPKRNESPEEYEAVLKEDIQKAQDRISEMTGQLPEAFAYPYGRYSDMTDDVLRKLGIHATLSCRYGINMLSPAEPESLFGLKRLCRAHNVPIRYLLTEAYKTIKRTPPEKPAPLSQ